MDNARLFAAIVGGMWLLAVVLVLLFVGWCLLHRYATDTHEGASLDSTVVMVLPTDIKVAEAAPAGRHHQGATEPVPDDYQPHIGRRLIARETQTQRLAWPQGPADQEQ